MKNEASVIERRIEGRIAKSPADATAFLRPRVRGEREKVRAEAVAKRKEKRTKRREIEAINYVGGRYSRETEPFSLAVC